MQEFYFQITEELVGQRLDKCLSILVDSLTRSYIQQLLKEEIIMVNKKIIKGSYKLKINDEITFSLPALKELDIKAEDIPLDILWEDADIVIVNKSKGMVVHPAAGHYSQTLVNALMFHCGEELSGINGTLRPGIVHRIDKDTTGSIIVCKNDFAHQSIAQQLKEHTITRKYHAICHGILKESSGVINEPIGREHKDRKKMTIVQNGKIAITHYKVLKQFTKYAYIECQLETGRTHQIRVHLNSIGHPILGDNVYGNRKSPFTLVGQTLHAKTIGFIHPQSKQYIEVDAPLPDYFQHLLNILEE